MGILPGLFNSFIKKDDEDDDKQSTTGSRVLSGLADGLGGGLSTGGLFGGLAPIGLNALSELLKKKKPQDQMGGM